MFLMWSILAIVFFAIIVVLSIIIYLLIDMFKFFNEIFNELIDRADKILDDNEL